MSTFVIEEDQNIRCLAPGQQPPEGAPVFQTEADLQKIAAPWSLTQLAGLWNSFAGVAPFDDLKPVKQFTHSKTATVSRIFQAVQRLNGGSREATEALNEGDGLDAAAAPTARPKKAPRVKKAPKPKLVKPKKEKKPKAAKPAKAPKAPRVKKDGAGLRDGSKGAKVIEMLKLKNGTTLKDIMEETGWLPHTARAFISVQSRKLGLTVEHDRKTGVYVAK